MGVAASRRTVQRYMISTRQILNDARPCSRRLISFSLPEAIDCP